MYETSDRQSPLGDILQPSRSSTERRANSTSVASTNSRSNADRLMTFKHVGGRGLLLQRLLEVARLRLHLVEQARVLDRDGSLVRESLDLSDLPFRERRNRQEVEQQDAQQVIAFEYRHGEQRPESLDVFRTEGKFWISHDIGNVDRSAFKRGAGRPAMPTGANRILFHKLLHPWER